ncbi:MAG: hypothetical protein ACXWGV_11270, partial [Solirubrobacterales bacterium]
ERQIGQRTVSRLIEMCGDPLQLHGSDRRIEFDPDRPDPFTSAGDEPTARRIEREPAAGEA